MTQELGIVLALLGAAIVMFAINRPRMDVVAVMMMVALPLTGVISVSEALAGFSNPSIVLIAALFVIGEALVRTGVAQRMGDALIARSGGSEARLIVALMAIVALLSSVMSSTGAVAIFIPIALRVARSAGLPVRRLLMPLAFAALIGGMLTLIGTPPNLLVHAELVRQGFDGFGFFAFAPFGVPILVLGVVYMLATRRLLARDPVPARPDRPGLSQWAEEYGLSRRAFRLRVGARSALAGRRLGELDLRSGSGVSILAVERPGRFSAELIHPDAQTRLEAGDVLLIDLRGPGDGIEAFASAQGLERLPLPADWFPGHKQQFGMAELLLPPTSRLVGKTLVQAKFRSTRDLTVIGLRHGRAPVEEGLLDQPLRPGDTLLVAGRWRAIRRLRDDRRDLILLDLPGEFDEVAPASRRAPLAVLVLLAVVAAMVSGVVPNVIAALLGCLALGLFRCIGMDGAFRAIHWQSLVLIVGMLPFSLALQRTGGVDLAAGLLVDAVGGAEPRLLLAAIFAVTAGLSLFISNTATAVLMAPVALSIAAGLDASPYPFAMTVALAASAAFSTPVSSPVNTLVVGPGDYRFFDFVKVGVPFTLLTLLVTVLLVPVLLPF